MSAPSSAPAAAPQPVGAEHHTICCPITSCSARIPTVVRYVPLTGDRYLLTTPVDQDALRAHLIGGHSPRRPLPTRLAGGVGMNTTTSPGATAAAPTASGEHHLVSPDCEQRKHTACSGDAWDHADDAPAVCACACHGDLALVHERLRAAFCDPAT